MAYRWFLKPRWLLLAPLMALLVVAIACGESDTPAPIVIEKEVIVEKEVVKIVPKEVVVEKEVVKEVIVEVPIMVVATPTAMPEKMAPPAAKVTRGGVVPFHKHVDPGPVDPHVSPSGHGGGTVAPVFNGLIMYNDREDGNSDEIVADLAESWEVVDGGMGILFKIRQGVKFHDGDTLTVEDVKYSIDRWGEEGEGIVRPQTKTAYNYMKDAEVVDPSTVKINMQFPAAAFLPTIALYYFAIVDEEWGKKEPTFTNKVLNLMGTGPFKTTKYSKGERIEFEAFPDYFMKGDDGENLPYTDGMVRFIIRDHGRTVAAFESEQVFMSTIGWTGLSIKDYLEMESNVEGRVNILYAKSMGANGMFINVQHKPFDDPRVRKALFLLTDRMKHSEIFLHGKGDPQFGPFPTWMGLSQDELAKRPGFRYTAAGEKDPADIAEAKALLKAAGVGDPFELTITVRTTGTYVDQASVLKSQWKDHGINVKVRALESVAGFAAYAAKDFEIGLISRGWVVDDPDQVMEAFYTPTAHLNYANWENPDLTALHAKQTQEADPAKRKAILNEMQDILLTGEGPYIGLLAGPNVWVQNVKVKGFQDPRSHATPNLRYERIWMEN